MASESTTETSADDLRARVALLEAALASATRERDAAIADRDRLRNAYWQL